MPAAKKKTSRRTSQKKGEGRITRREVEAATKRFDKALSDATTALEAMGKNFGRNAKTSYREVERALRTLRTDAKKANRNVLKDLEKLWAAAGPSSKSSRSGSGTATKRAKSTASKAKSATKRASRSKSSTAKSSAKSSAAKSSAAKSSAKRSKSSTAAKSSSARKRASSGSRKSSS